MCFFYKVAAIVYAVTAFASEIEPSAQLISENCSKAEAILEGHIVSTRTPPKQFSETTFRVSRVYRGPFKPKYEMLYYSFRETPDRQKDEMTGLRIIFLVSKIERGSHKRWGTATDISEFPSSSTLRRQVEKCGRR